MYLKQVNNKKIKNNNLAHSRNRQLIYGLQFMLSSCWPPPTLASINSSFNLSWIASQAAYVPNPSFTPRPGLGDERCASMTRVLLSENKRPCQCCLLNMWVTTGSRRGQTSPMMFILLVKHLVWHLVHNRC